MEIVLKNKEIKAPVIEDIECEEILSFCEEIKNGRITLNHTKFLKFLEESGFRTVRDGETIKLVHISENIITEIIPYDIKMFVITYAENNFNEEVNNYLLSSTKIYTADYLNSLEEVKPKLVRDTKDTSYHFYKNGIVKVTKESVEPPVAYKEFDQLVWAKQIINRDFTYTEISNDMPVFADFIFKLVNHNVSRFNYLCSIIGYALNNYRTTSNTRAIIINDEIVSDLPEGGSGKSLLIKSLGYIRNLVIKDGKTFNPKKSFEWSDIDESVDLVLLDETSANFSFEDLFSVITDGITVEKKYADKYRLPIEQSPLILITTNSPVAGYGGSHKRRQFNVDIYQYFNENHTPMDEYNHTFFKDWDLGEWAKFDTFMMQCVQYYLQNGIVKSSEINNKYKDAIRATNVTFVEWIYDVIQDFKCFTPTNTAIEKYKEETGQSYLKISERKFIGNLKSICKIFGYQFISDRTSEHRGFYIIFSTSS